MNDRYAEIHRLSTITDPDDFTRAAANTEFGAIDIFVLRKANGGWEYTANIGWGSGLITERFTSEQFDPADWTITDISGSNFVVTIRDSRRD